MLEQQKSYEFPQTFFISHSHEDVFFSFLCWGFKYGRGKKQERTNALFQTGIRKRSWHISRKTFYVIGWTWFAENNVKQKFQYLQIQERKYKQWNLHEICWVISKMKVSLVWAIVFVIFRILLTLQNAIKYSLMNIPINSDFRIQISNWH